METVAIQSIVRSLHFSQYLQQLQEIWQIEQEKRHNFWKNIDESQKAEFINGEGVYDSPIYAKHWLASSNILTELLPHVKKNKLGKVGVEKVMIRCSRNDYEPDICFWTKEKSENFSQKQSAFPPPDFVIEILSKSTEERDRGIKFEDYALHGVQEYWIVDTDRQSIEQYFLGDTQFELHKVFSEGSIESKIITGFRIAVKEIFE